MNKDLNEKEVCFILCGNDEIYMKECIYYIDHLRIPMGYQISSRIIENAKSMTAGYNQGMKSSDAKYKVYLHQDTFIVNHNFIYDCLEIFKDKEIGMIGMVGTSKLPLDGIMWNEERCGALYAWTGYSTIESRMEEVDCSDAEAVDGFLMVTQYDIPWRDDLFDRWDFYDCSQCKEFARAGYRIVVPKMETPWCLHDGYVADLTNYESQREVFLKEYQKDMWAYQEKCSYRATIILTSHNQKELLKDTLKWLENVDGITNIIVVDNGSTDRTSEWLGSQKYEYVWFDEGTQGYGKLWNAVIENFNVENYVIFLEVGVYPEKDSFIKLMEALNLGYAEIANPLSNYYPYENDVIRNQSSLKDLKEQFSKLPKKKRYKKAHVINWRMWAVQKSIFEKNGYFAEELKTPENVLADYASRLAESGYSQTICHMACAYDTFRFSNEKYAEADVWREEDRIILEFHGMKYMV